MNNLHKASHTRARARTHTHTHTHAHAQVTLTAKAASRRGAATGVTVNVSIAMDSSTQAANAVSNMTLAAINAQLLAVNLPAATLLSDPAVVTGASTTSGAASSSSTISASMHSAGNPNANIRAALAALAALALCSTLGTPLI